ncbi:MAG: hypothetical protein P8X60_11205, partial [Robiginitalea sp.]
VTLNTNTASGQEMLRIKAFVNAKTRDASNLGPVSTN